MRRVGGFGGRAAVGLATALAVAAAPGCRAQPAGGEASLAERARALHAASWVVDGHNDLPWRIREEAGMDLDALRLGERGSAGHTDVPRLREGGVDAQFWAAYIPAGLGADAPAATLEQMDLIRRLVAAFPDHLEMAYTTADVQRIAAAGRIASLIGIEGGHAIANSIPVLRQLYEAGARYLTLTHSQTLAWADAAGDTAIHGGLTEFGRAVVREMNRLGMLVDLSHVTTQVMHDALDMARAPVIFSHSSARALADHPRNVPDDVLRRLPANGGVVMVNFYSGFLVPEAVRAQAEMSRELRRLREAFPDSAEFAAARERYRAEHPIPTGTVGTIADHIEHVARVAGVDHVGLGSDFDGVSALPEGMEDVSRLPAITEELLRRGWAETDVRKVLGGNVLRAFEAAERVAERLRAEEPPGVERLPFRGLTPEEGR